MESTESCMTVLGFFVMGDDDDGDDVVVVVVVRWLYYAWV